MSRAGVSGHRSPALREKFDQWTSRHCARQISRRHDRGVQALVASVPGDRAEPRYRHAAIRHPYQRGGIRGHRPRGACRCPDLDGSLHAHRRWVSAAILAAASVRGELHGELSDGFRAQLTGSPVQPLASFHCLNQAAHQSGPTRWGTFQRTHALASGPGTVARQPPGNRAPKRCLAQRPKAPTMRPRPRDRPPPEPRARITGRLLAKWNEAWRSF